MSNRKKGIIAVSIGLILIISSLGVYVMQSFQDRTAGKNAALLMNQIYEILKQDVYYEGNVSLSGYEVMGIISIDSVGIELPVLDEWSYSLLDVAPCRLSGSLSDDNLIVMGHNYRSHFASMKNIDIGDQVTLTDMNGLLYSYVVSEIEQLHKTEIGKLESEDVPLTLFTCTYGGQNRLVIRCIK